MSNTSKPEPKLFDRTTPIEAFADALGARRPTPGGGSVTALAGALAAAMGEMVVNYSLGKKDLEVYRPALEQSLMELHRARMIMFELMVEDQAAYTALVLARKLPVSDPYREAQFNAALLTCIRIPQTIGATALAILDLCDKIVDQVNIHLLSDLAVCADLAMATLRCAGYSVRINLVDVSDVDERARLVAGATDVLSRGAIVIQRLSPRIWKRLYPVK